MDKHKDKENLTMSDTDHSTSADTVVTPPDTIADSVTKRPSNIDTPSLINASGGGHLYDFLGHPICEGQEAHVYTPPIGPQVGTIFKVSATALSDARGNVMPPYIVVMVPVILRAQPGPQGRSPMLPMYVSGEAPADYRTGSISINVPAM